MVFDKLKGKKLVLNKSILTSGDVSDFEIPPLTYKRSNLYDNHNLIHKNWISLKIKHFMMTWKLI